MRGCVTDAGQTNERTVKIELLSRWKLEAEFRNFVTDGFSDIRYKWDRMGIGYLSARACSGKQTNNALVEYIKDKQKLKTI